MSFVNKRRVLPATAPMVQFPAAEVQSQVLLDMTLAEANVVSKRIRASLESADKDFIIYHDQKGWKAQGYKSWKEGCEAEFSKTVRTIDRQLEAARTNLALSTQCDETRPMGLVSWKDRQDKITQCDETRPMGLVSEPLTERQARPLTGLPPEEKRAVVEAVIATSNGKVTAAAIQAVVKERHPKPTRPAKPDDQPALTVSAPALSPYQKIMRAAEAHKGLHLTEAEVFRLSTMTAIVEAADDDDRDTKPTEESP